MASNSFCSGGGGGHGGGGGGSNGRASSRKKSLSKSSEMNKKKKPGRGMGVAKLERLIHNDDANGGNQKNPCPSFPYAFIPTAGFIAAADPCSNLGTGNTLSPPLLPSTMFPFSRYVPGGGGGGCLSLNIQPGGGGCGGGPAQQQQQQQHQLMMGGDGAVTGGGGGGGLGHQGGGGGLQRSICVDYQLKGNSLKELPSIPNLSLQQQQCDFCPDCSKKKRPQRYEFNKMVFDGLSPSFLDQGAKVVALHRTKATTLGGGQENQVVMEYDFFPEEGKKKSGGSFGRGETVDEDELLMMKLGETNGGAGDGEVAVSGAGGGGVSCLTTANTRSGSGGDGCSTYMDLSLKLSY